MLCTPVATRELHTCTSTCSKPVLLLQRLWGSCGEGGAQGGCG